MFIFVPYAHIHMRMTFSGKTYLAFDKNNYRAFGVECQEDFLDFFGRVLECKLGLEVWVRAVGYEGLLRWW